MSLLGHRSNQWLKDFESELFPMMATLDRQPQTQLRHWSPKVDIKEEKSQYLVLVDLPGIEPKDIDIEMEDSTLTIKGEKHSEVTKESSDYYHTERAVGKFYRQFCLPDSVSKDDVVAKFKHGVLTLCIPKSMQQKVKKISIEAEM
tara:strand:+ start:199 stop:636 length:438 start_codon:yes stop_codon:yes gene_type:complete